MKAKYDKSARAIKVGDAAVSRERALGLIAELSDALVAQHEHGITDEEALDRLRAFQPELHPPRAA